MRRQGRHAYLYDVTSAIHAQVEEAVERARFFEHKDAYADYLRRLHLFHRRATSALASTQGEMSARWGMPARTTWLERDLHDLGMRAIESDPSAMSAPTAATREEAYGLLYVLIGSALGARVLLRRAEHLTGPAGEGLAYLKGLAVSSHWPRFIECLEAEPQLAGDGLASGAVSAFTSVLDHMTRRVPQ